MLNNKEIKSFVKKWNFYKPDWNSLPKSFPNLEKKGLTTEECHIVDAVKLAWTIEDGRYYLYRSFGLKVILGFSIVSLIIFLTTLFANPSSFTKSVEAKSLSQTVEDVVVSTMSAVFKK